jgi:hypothetical protein
VTSPQPVELSPLEASALISHELQQARRGLYSADIELALDALAAALGLALQLGPAATEWVLAGTVDAARYLAGQQDANALSALGPALAGLTSQVRDAAVLPSISVMEAWAEVASALGALIGQVGLALTIAPDHGSTMMENARAQALLLDDATGNMFALTAWIDQVAVDLNKGKVE